MDNQVKIVLPKRWKSPYSYDVYTKNFLSKEIMKIKLKIVFNLAIKNSSSFKREIILGDIGCGFGYLTLNLIKNFPNSLVFSVDKDCIIGQEEASSFFSPKRWSKGYCGRNLLSITKEMLSSELTSNELRRVKILNANLLSGIPLNNEFFDVIFCLDVLEHIGNLDRAIKEISRLISRKGLIVISVPLTSGLSWFLRNLGAIILGYSEGDDPDTLDHKNFSYKRFKITLLNYLNIKKELNFLGISKILICIPQSK